MDAVIGYLPNTKTCHLSPETFVTRLVKDWPLVDYKILKGVKTPDDFKVNFRWVAGEGAYGEEIVNGLFTGIQLSLDGDEKHFYDFAVWYRKLVPTDYKLFFGYDDFYGNAVEVRDGMSAAELEAEYKNTNKQLTNSIWDE